MIFSSQQKPAEYFKNAANANTIYVGEKPNSVSFSGCGFLGVYHIGVASCLKQHAPNWLKSVDRVYGCSAGSIIGAMLLSDVCFGEVCQKMMNIVKDLRSRYLGPLSPGFQLNETLLNDMQNGLPANAHILASGKLFISLTRFRDGKNVIVSDYQSRDELIQVLLSSCFVPFYSGLFPPKYRGVRYVDGGLSNNLPSFHDTITVSPWSGNSDICPRNDESESLIDLNFVNTSIQMTASNLYRISTMFFPPSPEVLREFCCQGFCETVQYLRDNGLFETVHPLQKNLSFSTLLHKVEERRKITRRMSYKARCLHENDGRSTDADNDTLNERDRNLTSNRKTGDLKTQDNCEESDIESNLFPLIEDADRGEENLNVFTVVQVYPDLVEDITIGLQFQLPSPILDALESSLERRGRRVWMTHLMTLCRRPAVLHLSLEKTYVLANYLLRHSLRLSQGITGLMNHLSHLVAQLHSYFKCSGQVLIHRLKRTRGNVQKDIVLLANEMAVVVQLIVKILLQRSMPFYSSLAALKSSHFKSKANLSHEKLTMDIV